MSKSLVGAKKDLLLSRGAEVRQRRQRRSSRTAERLRLGLRLGLPSPPVVKDPPARPQAATAGASRRRFLPNEFSVLQKNSQGRN